MRDPTPQSSAQVDPPLPNPRQRSAAAAAPAAALALLAALLSFAGSWNASLWTDEAVTISAAQRSLPELWALLSNIDAVHGLYYAFMHLWGEAFGYSPVALRLPSALAIGLATAGLYLLARQLAGSQVALAASLIFAILPRTTWMGMEGRSFAFSATAVVWLSVLLGAAVASPEKRWRKHLLFGAYALLAALGTYLNIYVALAVAAHGLILLILPRIPRSVVTDWAAASLLAAALASPVVFSAARQAGQLGTADLSLFGLLRSVVVDQWFLGETPTNPYLSLPGLQLWQPASILLALTGWMLIFAAMMTSAVSAQNRWHRATAGPGIRTSRLLLICAAPLLIFPTSALIAFSLLASPIYNARYLSFATPAAALLVALGLLSLRRRRVRATAAVLLVLLALPIYVSQRQSEGKSGSDWAQVAAYVEEQADDGDAVYFGPRRPPTDAEVGQTQRRIATAYPKEFAGLKDVNLLHTGSADGSLDGHSRLLQDCGPGMQGLDTVWLVRRMDYPADLLDAEDRWMTSQGFLPTDEWAGTTNTVTGFSRTPPA